MWNPSKYVEFHNLWVWIPSLPIRNTLDWYATVSANLGIQLVELVPHLDTNWEIRIHQLIGMKSPLGTQMQLMEALIVDHVELQNN